jgi:hypothetical protein
MRCLMSACLFCASASVSVLSKNKERCYLRYPLTLVPGVCGDRVQREGEGKEGGEMELGENAQRRRAAGRLTTVGGSPLAPPTQTR